MPPLLIERLNAERRRFFIGRQHECDQFKTVIHAEKLPFAVLHLFGSIGVGKTTLLREWMQMCQSWQVPVAYFDARTLKPSSDAFLNLLRSAMHLSATEAPIQVLASQLNRYVLLIDSYEILTPLDDWLREVFLPQLSAHVLVVLAGRCPPTSMWRVDPGWQSLLHPISLQNLTPEESQLYLRQRSIPVVQHQSMLNFAQGHPLTLSLLADAWAQEQKIDRLVRSEPISDEKKLLAKDLAQVPSSIHRSVLETCTIMHLLTETLLPELLEHVAEANFAKSGQQYELYGHDWCAIFPSAWHKRLIQQETSPSAPLRDAPLFTECPLVFSQPEFVNAVQEALRHFARPDLLYHTPLLRSRLVLEQANTTDHAKRIEVLQDYICEATESLQRSPRDAKLYRALHRTYLSPAATQEQAAESLDLPFSTYRRHLKSGVTRVAGILWQWEVQESIAQTS